MKAKFRVAGYALMVSLAALIQACSPSSVANPISSLPPAPAVASSGSKAGGEGQRGGAKESDAGASSLKQLQEGKAPITPASSPLEDVFLNSTDTIFPPMPAPCCAPTPIGSRATRRPGLKSKAIAMNAAPTNII